MGRHPRLALVRDTSESLGHGDTLDLPFGRWTVRLSGDYDGSVTAVKFVTGSDVAARSATLESVAEGRRWAARVCGAAS